MCAVDKRSEDSLSGHIWTCDGTAIGRSCSFPAVNAVNREVVVILYPGLTFGHVKLLPRDTKRGRGRDKDNEEEVCEGYLYRVSQGIT